MISRTKVSVILQQYAEEVKLPYLLYKLHKDNVVQLYTDRPGILIGKAGSIVEKYRSLLNEIVVEDNNVIRKVNDKRIVAFNELYKDTPTNERPHLILMPYEQSAEIVFVECNNSLTDSSYDPMSECM